MKKRTHDGLLQELGSLFFSTRQIIRAKLPSGKNDPNSWLRFETLNFIRDAGAPTMQEVAAYLRVKAPSATSLIAHLASQGLVRRSGEARDKRVIRLRLTARGERALAQHRHKSNVIMREVFAKFSPKDVRELARILRQLRDMHTDAGA